MNYSVFELKFNNIKDIFIVAHILTICGKDMFEKNNLKHWKNSLFKNILIVFYTMLKKNTVFIIYEDKNVLGTFQIKLKNNSVIFSKLAVYPQYQGKHIGSFCLNYIENIAKINNKNFIECDVYEKSKHAINFYKKRGFTEKSISDTLKYKILNLEKKI